MLIRHPDLFYVSLKGERDSVFLREAYRNSHLIEKDQLLLIKEKLRSLVNVPRFPRRNASRRGDDGAKRTDEMQLMRMMDFMMTMMRMMMGILMKIGLMKTTMHHQILLMMLEV
ncbi:hypothetical protein NL676_011721 [Syzygium grande]|nr:hypothetical protein NL676_011721 [Syzygium grande]